MEKAVSEKETAFFIVIYTNKLLYLDYLIIFANNE